MKIVEITKKPIVTWQGDFLGYRTEESEPIEISEEQLSDKKFELECQGIAYNYRIIA
jgi:hypothetical protein